MDYATTADTLAARIVALGPCVLDLDDAWQLFKVPGFKCDDLQPSYAQASAALVHAQRELKAREEQK